MLERQRTDENLLPEPGYVMQLSSSEGLHKLRNGRLDSPWTYKAPSRVVYNATRLESWYAELANPAVPLSKLAKNIPSAPSSSSQSIMSTGTGTYTGSTSSPGPAPAASKFSGTAMDKNLEMLINRQVPLYRAIWFLQAVGQNDIAQMSKAKNLQIHPILSYSADYTGALVESLKRQIGEAVLPLTQTAGAGRLLPGMSVKGRPRNILAEEHSRERWLAKWNYTLELLSASLDEGMLDRQRLCSLLLQQMQPQTRLQMLWWLSVILQTTIDDMLATAWMSKALVIVLFEWLQCLDETAAAKDDTTVICHTVARSLLRHIWLTDSDMFLVPQIWSKESDADQLKSALGIGGDGDAAYDDSLLWNELEQRANILLCKGGPATKLYTSLLCDAPDARTLSKGGVASQEWTTAASEVVRLLDMWTGTESIESITSTLLNFSFSSNLSGVAEETSNYHDSCSDHPTSLHPEVVKLLLCWATTTTRHGDHRAYLVNSILASYLGLPPRISLLPSLPGDAVLNDLPSTDMDRFEALQDCIMQWIDCQEQSLSGEAQSSSLIEWTSREATLSMCYLLLNSKVLDISGLVQKVIARGSTHTGDFHGEGIYVQILKDYGGSSKRAALRWQMGRVSVDGKAVDESKTLENAQAIIQRELQPLLQQLRNAEEGTQYRLPPLEIEDIRAGLSSLSVMKKVWLLTTWLVPIVHEALQANQR